jgi:hypothetical protein
MGRQPPDNVDQRVPPEVVLDPTVPPSSPRQPTDR